VEEDEQMMQLLANVQEGQDEAERWDAQDDESEYNELWNDDKDDVVILWNRAGMIQRYVQEDCDPRLLTWQKINDWVGYP
jgi:hypothetical protein